MSFSEPPSTPRAPRKTEVPYILLGAYACRSWRTWRFHFFRLPMVSQL